MEAAVALATRGDCVLARAEDYPNASIRPRAIERTHVHTAHAIAVYVAGRQILATAEHPFFVADRGWVPVGELGEGDLLLGHDGRLTPVGAIDCSPRVMTVYNLTVADDHTYFVGSPAWGFSLWVHNTYTAKQAANGLWEVRNAAGDVVLPDVSQEVAEATAKQFNEAELAGDLAAAAQSVPPVTFTKEMIANSEVIARGSSIRKIDELVAAYGGTRRGWVKKKGWDAFGNEWHWYEHHGIGRRGVKPAGEVDPF